MLPVLVAAAWLPYSATRCLATPDGGHVDCGLFGSEARHDPSAHHQDDKDRQEHHAHTETDSDHRHPPDQPATCCEISGKEHVVNARAAPWSPAPLSALVLFPERAGCRVVHSAPSRPSAPFANAPPIFLRNAALLI